MSAFTPLTDIPPVVVMCGAAWEKQWLTEDDPQVREYIELMCKLKYQLPSDEYDAARNRIFGRMREARDDAAAVKEAAADALPTPELASFQQMFEMVSKTFMDLPPDRSLTICVNSLRVVRRRWGKDEFASANMNTLLIVSAYAGLLLTGLGHPDFLTEDELAAKEGGAA